MSKESINYKNKGAELNGWADWFNIDNSDLEPEEKRMHEITALESALHLAVADLAAQSSSLQALESVARLLASSGKFLLTGKTKITEDDMNEALAVYQTWKENKK